MRRFTAWIAAAVLSAWPLGGCTEFVDGQVTLDLAFPCQPSMAELGPQIGLYCLSVYRDGSQVAGPTCSTGLDTAALELAESFAPVRIELEVLDLAGVTLLRGVSPAVSLLSGEQDHVPLALAPAQGFGLVAGQGEGCTPLPHPLVGHTASLFPSGHLLLLGSARPEVASDRSGLVLDGYTYLAASLTTPDSLHRHQHTASLLDDGQLLVAGGLLAENDRDLVELVSLPGGSALTEPYVDGWDYTRAIDLQTLPTRLISPRPVPDASVFFGSQVLLVDGLSPPEMFLASAERTEAVTFVGLPGSPFPPNDRTARVVPYTEDRALVPGLGSGRLARLTVQEGEPQAQFQVVVDQTAARDHPAAVWLSSGRIMVLGGLVGASVMEGPVVVWGVNGDRTDVPLPVGFPVKGFTATALGDGRVLVVGGVDGATSLPSQRTFLFIPAEAGFRVERGPELRLPRHGHTATLLSDGRLVVAGGEGGLPDGSEDAAWSVEILAVGRP